MVDIRIARETDAPWLPVLEHSAGESFRAISELAWIADGEDRSAGWYRELLARGASWLAVERGDPVGFLAAEVIGRELHIWEFAVRQDRQRCGHGRALFGAALADARARELDAITLTTFRDVSWNEALYQRLGFVTLDRGQAGARLEAVLAAEIERGLPAARRCAMRLAMTR